MKSLCAALIMMSTPALSAGLEYKGKVIPPLCVKAITVDINGDHNSLSIPLDKTLFRGCFESNEISSEFTVKDAKVTSKLPDGGTFSYELVANIEDDVYLLKTSETTTGTYAGSSYIIVKIEDQRFVKDESHALAWQTVKALVFKGDVLPANANPDAIIAFYKTKAAPKGPN